MQTSQRARTLLLLVRGLGAAAALIVVGVAVASALGSSPAAAGPPAPHTTGPPAQPLGPPARAAPTPCDRAAPAGSGVVNINQATAEQLQLLPGIGPAKAARIIEHRQRRGPFTRLRDLRRVKGIGVGTLRRLAPLLSLDGPTTMTAKGKPR